MRENAELHMQLEVIAEDTAIRFMDLYRCMDWGITPRRFAKKLIKTIYAMVMEYAKGMESDDNA